MLASYTQTCGTRTESFQVKFCVWYKVKVNVYVISQYKCPFLSIVFVEKTFLFQLIAFTCFLKIIWPFVCEHYYIPYTNITLS